MKNKKQNNGPQ